MRTADGASGGAGPFDRGPCVSQDAQAGRSQGWPKGADRKAPEAPPGAPFPSFEGNKENRETGPPRGPKSKPRDSGALAVWQSNQEQITACQDQRAPSPAPRIASALAIESASNILRNGPPGR